MVYVPVMLALMVTDTTAQVCVRMNTFLAINGEGNLQTEPAWSSLGSYI